MAGLFPSNPRHRCKAQLFPGAWPVDDSAHSRASALMLTCWWRYNAGKTGSTGYCGERCCSGKCFYDIDSKGGSICCACFPLRPVCVCTGLTFALLLIGGEAECHFRQLAVALELTRPSRYVASPSQPNH